MKIYLALDGTKDVTPRVRAEMAGRVGVACLVCVLPGPSSEFPKGKDPDDLTEAEWDAIEGDARPALDEWITAIEGEADAEERKRLRERLGEQAAAWIAADPSGAGEIRARLASGLGLTAADVERWVGEGRAETEGGRPEQKAETGGPLFPNQPEPLGRVLGGEAGRPEITNYFTEYRSQADEKLVEKAAGDAEKVKSLALLKELDRERLASRRARAEWMRRKKEIEKAKPEWLVDGKPNAELNALIHGRLEEIPPEMDEERRTKLSELVAEWGAKEKAAMVAKNTDAIRSEVKFALKGWPLRLVSGGLFVDDSRTDKLGPPVLMVSDSSRFLSLLHDYGRVKFNRGQDADKANYISSETLFTNLCASSDIEAWLAVERFPHEPPLPGHYYAWRPPADQTYQPDGRFLAELVTFFDNVIKPHHRALLAASIVTPFWGGPYGRRPFFWYYATGQDSGKTTCADLVAQLCGGFMAINFDQRAEERLKERMLSDDGACVRMLLADNVVGRADSPLLAEVATASRISGKKLGVGEAWRPNNFCVFLTGNNPTMTRDLQTRTFFVRFEPIAGDAVGKNVGQRSNWAERLREFVAEHRDKVIADCLWILRQPKPAVDWGALKSERNSEWSQDVLCRVLEIPAVKAVLGGETSPLDVLQRTIDFRESVDDEREEAETFLMGSMERIVEAYGFHFPSGLDATIHLPKQDVFVRATAPARRAKKDDEDQEEPNIVTWWRSIFRRDVNAKWLTPHIQAHIEGGRLPGVKWKRTSTARGFEFDAEAVVRFLATRDGRNVLAEVEEWRANVFQKQCVDVSEASTEADVQSEGMTE